MILSTIDFTKAFDSVWHPTLFHKVISAGLPSLLCSLDSIFPFWQAHLCGFSKSQKSFLLSPSRCFARICSWPCTFSLFINDLPTSLPSSISCSLYTDDLAISSSSLSVPTAMETTQALFWLERWSAYWCLPLNPSKCEVSFSVDPHQAHLQPNILLLGSRLRFNPTPTFLGVTFDCTLSFSKHVSSLKAKFFPHLKALCYISASSRSPSLFCINLFFGPFLPMLHLDGFLS